MLSGSLSPQQPPYTLEPHSSCEQGLKEGCTLPRLRASGDKMWPQWGEKGTPLPSRAPAADSRVEPTTHARELTSLCLYFPTCIMDIITMPVYSAILN